jgi:hypothetical protein
MTSQELYAAFMASRYGQAISPVFESQYTSFWSDVLATIIGGVILALIFFAVKERLMPVPKIMGRWYLQQNTINSAYNPFKGMTLRYVVMLFREGNRLEGTAEKYYEKSSNGQRAFVGKNRTRAVVTGHVEKNVFARDRVFIHMTENGHGRESTYFYEFAVRRVWRRLRPISVLVLQGTFFSMVADQDGTAECRREQY